MKINDLLLMAVKNLRARKLRTFLTVLGVIIGGIAIIVTVSLGNGMHHMNQEMIEQWGEMSIIEIYGFSDPRTGKYKDVDAKMLRTLSGKDHVKSALGTLNYMNHNLKIGRYTVSFPQIIGVDPTAMKYFEFDIEDGRSFNDHDSFSVILGKGVIAQLGTYTPSSFIPANVDVKTANLELVPPKDGLRANGDFMTSQPAGQNKDLKSYRVKYVGTLKESNDWDINNGVYMPIDTVRQIMIDNGEKERDVKNKIQSIKIKVDDVKNVVDLNDSLKNEGYQTFALSDIAKESEKQIFVVQAILGGIGAISLLVAAIGISNTMVMSVQERTKEIGIMKVIGAEMKDIQNLFLTEASMIGLLGGIIGVILSYLISFGINFIFKNFAGAILMDAPSGISKISIIPLDLTIIALVFSAGIGLISGYFPARKAMRLSALDAIRSN